MLPVSLWQGHAKYHPPYVVRNTDVAFQEPKKMTEQCACGETHIWNALSHETMMRFAYWINRLGCSSRCASRKRSQLWSEVEQDSLWRAALDQNHRFAKSIRMRADAVAYSRIDPHRSGSRRIPHASGRISIHRNSFGGDDPGVSGRLC